VGSFLAAREPTHAIAIVFGSVLISLASLLRRPR
jgi:hypothetical protein